MWTNSTNEYTNSVVYACNIRVTALISAPGKRKSVYHMHPRYSRGARCSKHTQEQCKVICNRFEKVRSQKTNWEAGARRFHHRPKGPGPIQGVGYWELGLRVSELGIRSPESRIGSWVLGVGYWESGTGSWVQE